MNPIIQPGMHPDADTLTAFAEQLLPANEREQVLAHAAVCNRCREVIFLAQQTSAAEPMTAATMPDASSSKPSVSLWSGWRWAWIPVGALAALIGVATVLHVRHAGTQTQMAQNSKPEDTLHQNPPTASAQPAETTKVQARARERNAPHSLKPQAARDRLAVRENEGALDEKATTKRREAVLGSPVPPGVLAPGVVGGSIHGAMTARAKAAPYGGPMANDLQQNAIQQQNALQQQNQSRQNAQFAQNALSSAQGFDQKPADTRNAPVQAPVPSSETVSVQAEPVKSAPTAAPMAPPMQLSYAPMTAKSLGLSPAATAELKKANVALPGGAQALSVAFGQGRTVALDTSGALFFSEDRGKHWKSVSTQWTGRAVLVRNIDLNKDKADILQSVQKAPAAHFELVNDKLQTWKSSDGQTWTAESAPNK